MSGEPKAVESLDNKIYKWLNIVRWSSVFFGQENPVYVQIQLNHACSPLCKIKTAQIPLPELKAVIRAAYPEIGMKQK